MPMNEFDGFAHPVRGGGWRAMLRFARDAKPKPLLDKGGKPIWYEDEVTATKAVLAHVLAYFNGHLVCSGEIAGGSIKAAKFEKADKLLFRKGKVIPVTHVRGAANRDR